MLGRLRLGPENLRGRQFPEPAHPYRNDFQRDRDRIIHSRAFRRLEGKTQVFSAGLHDHFRNRLTHTIEVSQVARTVANALQLNEEYTETLALAHDLGHPPFGHVGERELDAQMRRFGSNFEHNRHALRIVDHLECRYARFDGLNLTFEVREGIVKHSRELSDLDELFTVDQIGEFVPAFQQLAEAADTQFPGAPEHIRFWEVQRHVINLLVGGLVAGTVQAVEEAGVETLDDVRNADHRLARLSEEALSVNRQMRKLLVEKVYSYAKLMEDRSSAVCKLKALFEYLIAHPDQVSPTYRERLNHEPVHRVVCDYIAGMTDAYLLKSAALLLG